MPYICYAASASTTATQKTSLRSARISHYTIHNHTHNTTGRLVVPDRVPGQRECESIVAILSLVAKNYGTTCGLVCVCACVRISSIIHAQHRRICEGVCVCGPGSMCDVCGCASVHTHSCALENRERTRRPVLTRCSDISRARRLALVRIIFQVYIYCA